MSNSQSPKATEGRPTIQGTLGLWDGISTIVGLMVGSGIFSSAGLIQQHVGSSGMALLLWMATGVLALTGALCYAEMGTTIPGSGGEAQYIQHGFGSWATFLFNWTSILLLKPGTVAILSTASANYLLMMAFAIGSGDTAGHEQELVKQHVWLVKIIGIACCIIVTLCASLSTKWSHRIQRVLTVGKLLALASVILLGLYYVALRDTSIVRSNLGRPFRGTASAVDSYAKAFCLGLWAFEGWNNLNIIAGDLVNPHRILPLSIWISVSAVVLLYLMTLLGYYCVLPASIITSSEIIGVEFGQAVIGRAGSILMPLFIAMSTFGAALSSMATSFELVVLAAETGQLPSLFARFNQRTGTAIYAYMLQCLLSSLLVLSSGFESLVMIYTFPQWLFYGAVVVILLMMRWKEPERPRPYRVWLSTPIIFLISCLVLMGATFWAEKIQVGAAFLVVLLGLPIYFLFIRQESPYKRWRAKRSGGGSCFSRSKPNDSNVDLMAEANKSPVN